MKNVTKKISNLHEDLEKIINKSTILIGHSLENDLHAMKMIHEKVIDTSILFARKNGSKMKLKTLAFNILKVLLSLYRDKFKWTHIALKKIAKQLLI